MSNNKFAMRPMVPEAVFTDRREHIDYFHRSAMRAIERRSMATVLLGQRRMGKSEIFKRVVNRLFFEQDHKDPKAAVPVFFVFPDEVLSREEFALEYTENFVRWYAAFRLNDPGIITKSLNRNKLIEYIKGAMEISAGFSNALDLLKAIETGGVTLPDQKALRLPKSVSDWDDSTIVMFLDEFQNTWLPEYGFRVVGFMQDAVETNTCIHYVTGSALSMLADEILGKGALYGRFQSRPIKPFSDYYGEELTLRAAEYYGAGISRTMAPVISNRCGGNPFYITAVVRRAAEDGKSIDDENALNETLAADISSGFIWAELSDQVRRWIDRTNEYGITKWILYLAAGQETEEIDLEQIQIGLKTHEFVDVPIQKIKEVMIRLARGDLLEFKSFGNWFGKINDPILNEFIKVWGLIEVEKQLRPEIEERTLKQFSIIEKRFHEYKGHLAEVYMIQVLWNSQGKTLPGKYFHSADDIKIPNRFFYIDQRRRMGAGRKMEVDIYGGAATEVWLAESKWWTGKKAGPDIVEHLLRQGEIVRQREEKYLKILRLWIFAHDGFTRQAENRMEKNNVLWSTREDLDALLETVNLRKLPVL